MAFKDKTRAVEYVNRYTADKYRRFNVFTTRAEGAEIEAAAASAGVSLNSFILEAIRSRMSARKL